MVLKQSACMLDYQGNFLQLTELFPVFQMPCEYLSLDTMEKWIVCK